MKDAYKKLLLELMVHSRRSDRLLARELGLSQPTVTRARQWLEANGYIVEYSLIPNFSKIGLELVAFSFIRLRSRGNGEKYEEIKKRASNYFNTYSNVVMALRGEGMGCDGIVVSLHKSFAEFTRFMKKLKTESADTEVVGSFLASLEDSGQYRHLTFRGLKTYLGANPEQVADTVGAIELSH
jgi:DNA-binding Lrp family transcriptional regulator